MQEEKKTFKVSDIHEYIEKGKIKIGDRFILEAADGTTLGEFEVTLEKENSLTICNGIGIKAIIEPKTEKDKKIKGWELMKLISEEKIKDGDTFNVIFPFGDTLMNKVIYYNDKLFLVAIDGTFRISLSLYYSDKQFASFIFEKIENIIDDTKEETVSLLDVSKAESPFEEEMARKLNEILIELEKLGKGEKTNE